MLHDKYLHMYSDQFLQCYVICYHRYFVRIKHYCLHSLNKPVYNDQLFNRWQNHIIEVSVYVAPILKYLDGQSGSYSPSSAK